jgi:hypothetical protein
MNDMSDLVSLGCAYYGVESNKFADPEKTILMNLNCFNDKIDVFYMLMGALIHRVHELIHVERLFTLAKDIPDEEKVLLKVLSLKLDKKGDHRYGLISRKLKVKKGTEFKELNSNQDRYLMEKWGFDKEFKRFGILTPNLPIPPRKKYFSTKGILKRSHWLRWRALMGSNYRTDLAYLISIGRVSKPVDALAHLECSKALIYRMWKNVSLINLSKFSLDLG